MRPKVKILCVNGNEQQLSLLRYMLTVNGYNVVAAQDPLEAQLHFMDAMSSCDGHIRLVLVVVGPIDPVDAVRLVAKLRTICNWVPMVFLSAPAPLEGLLHQADDVLDNSRISAAILLERIKLLAKRKCGPRPGSKHEREKNENLPHSLADVPAGVAAVCPAAAGAAQLTPAQPYTSDHGQLIFEHMKSLNLQWQLLEDNYKKQQTALQQDYTRSDTELRAWEDKVRTANHWGLEAEYDAEKNQWLKKPAPAVPASAPAPDPKASASPAAPAAKK